MEINAILEDLERAFGKDSAQFKFIISSIRNFPKGFEMPITSTEEFEKMVRGLPCLQGSPPGDGLPDKDADGRPKNMGGSYTRLSCPHCRALKLVEKLKQGN